MIPRLVLALVLPILLLASALRAEESKLTERVFRLPPDLFLEMIAGGGARAIAPAPGGEPRFDAMEYFLQRGLHKGAGVFAIAFGQSKAVVVRASLADLDLIGQGFQPCCMERSLRLIEMAAHLWEYEDDEFLGPAEKPHTIKEMRARAGDSLRLLDTLLVLTKSGNRAISENKHVISSPANLAPKKDSPKDGKSIEESGPFLDNARGSILEVEPNIGPEGEVEYQIGYQARLGRKDGEADLAVRAMTNATLRDQGDAIIFTSISGPAARAGKVRYVIVTVGVRLFDEQGRSMADLTQEHAQRKKAQREEDQRLIRLASEEIAPIEK
jgi:hypothetical protein